MALVALGGMPMMFAGPPVKEGTPYLPSNVSTLMDAANEACIMYGYMFNEDGASHTIDTTGSSSLGWLTGAVTFANGGTTVKVGLGTMDTTTGPPGRATNVADVITFSVSKSLTGGGGGITASAWQSHVPDAGTMTIAHGDFVAFSVQMTARGGVDAVNVVTGTAAVSAAVLPSVTGFTGGTYAQVAAMTNCLITYSDGKIGTFLGGIAFATASTTQTWNNTSATKEYGNFLQFPAPVRVSGLITNCSVLANTDFILYSDPLGTPVAQKTVSVDANAIGIAAVGRWNVLLFPAPYSATANQPLAAIIKPTTASNISSPYMTLNASNDQKTLILGTNCYAVNRNTGAFAAQNSSKDRWAIGVIIDGIDAGGGGGGLLTNPGMGGGMH